MMNINKVEKNLKRETEILRKIASATEYNEIMKLSEEYQAVKAETDRLMNEQEEEKGGRAKALPTPKAKKED